MLIKTMTSQVPHSWHGNGETTESQEMERNWVFRFSHHLPLSLSHERLLPRVPEKEKKKTHGFSAVEKMCIGGSHLPSKNHAPFEKEGRG